MTDTRPPGDPSTIPEADGGLVRASVDPARSLGVALVAGPAALGRVRVFLIAPVAGAAIAGLLLRAVTGLRPGLGGESAS